ncbi:MAG: hypothetical protein K2X99_03855 [Gemmatimonadaceae bacterium]|nr:hypothetical protein [Gemmatimonadaceae bacterium]
MLDHPAAYTPDAPTFPFRALAEMAGTAPMGGARETALATLAVARLASRAAPPFPLAAAIRAQRADAARQWLASLPLGLTVRSALGALLSASARDDAAAMGVAIRAVMDVTAQSLDRGARSELERLAKRLAE